jgi:hypothetical protein
MSPSPSLNLGASAAEEVERIAASTGFPPNEVVGLALRLLSIAVEAKAKKRKVLVTSQTGYPIEELRIA